MQNNVQKEITAEIKHKWSVAATIRSQINENESHSFIWEKKERKKERIHFRTLFSSSRLYFNAFTYTYICQTWASLFSTLVAGQLLFTYEWLIEKYLSRNSSWQKYETNFQEFHLHKRNSKRDKCAIVFVTQYKKTRWHEQYKYAHGKYNFN